MLVNMKEIIFLIQGQISDEIIWKLRLFLLILCKSVKGYPCRVQVYYYMDTLCNMTFVLSIYKYFIFMKSNNAKTNFTRKEFDEIVELVSQLQKSSSDKQKGIRAKIRKRGLYWSQVASGVPYTIEELNGLIRKGVITIEDETYTPMSNESGFFTKIKRRIKPFYSLFCNSSKSANNSDALMNPDNFKRVSDLNFNDIPSSPGLYAIKIDNPNALPKEFEDVLKERNHNLLYIGITTDTLRNRLWEQELHSKKPATFFRSIGAILGYTPEPGSLKGKSNNYKFSNNDCKKIEHWMEEHLLVNFIEQHNNLEETETVMIEKYIPIINIAKNPHKLVILQQLRKRCVEIGKGINV